MNTALELPPEIRKGLELQAQKLTEELGGRLRAWKIYGSKWPIVLVTHIEASSTKRGTIREGFRLYCVLKVVVLSDGEVKQVKYTSTPSGFLNGDLANKVYRNFVEVEKNDGKFCPKR